MRRFFTPKWILSHLFVAAMVVLMVNLGFWQLRRLDDRHDRNDDVRSAMEAEPAELGELLSGAELPPDHTAAVLRGTYLGEHSFLVANRTYDAQAGSWLVTPLELADGTVIVISRGWVPRLWAAGSDPRDLTPPTGEVIVTGRTFTSVGGGRIGSGNIAILPELNRLDLARVEELTGLDVADLWVQLDQQAPALGSIPVPVPPPGLDQGPHLSYAFQWFFFSTGTVVAYGLILRRRHDEPVEEPEPVLL